MWWEQLEILISIFAKIWDITNEDEKVAQFILTKFFTFTFLRLQNFNCFMKSVQMTIENCFPILGIMKGCSSQSFSSFFWKFCQVNSIPEKCFSYNKKHFLSEIDLFIYNHSRFAFFFMRSDWFSSRGQKKHIKFSNFFLFLALFKGLLKSVGKPFQFNFGSHA